MSRTTCPTLRPTLAEFEDFDALIIKAEEEARGAGRRRDDVSAARVERTSGFERDASEDDASVERER